MKTYKNVQKCTKMYKNVQKCTKNVQKCTKMYKNENVVGEKNNIFKKCL